jgi:hypothetical protein
VRESQIRNMTISRIDLGRDIEDALGWLSSQQRDLSEVRRLIDTAQRGGWVPYDVLDSVLNEISREQEQAAEQLRRVRRSL